MIWILYTAIVLVVSGLVGFHLGRFREAYTEMTGMMCGMTMGMLNGFLLGYTAAAVSSSVVGVTATVSLFWGNLFGISLGLLFGGYFGRAGGLMGIMDGAMGGLMGGSMGAMLAAMLTFPEWALLLTAVILLVVYLVSMLSLVALIEKSAPGHAALHVIAPYFTRAVAEEAAEELAPTQANPADHYAFLGLSTAATTEEITEAYVARVEGATPGEVERAERALLILTDPARRSAYDRALEVIADSVRPDCCPPKRKKRAAAASAQAVPAEQPARQAVVATTTQAKRGNGNVQSKSARRGVPAPQKSGMGPGAAIGGGLAVLVLLGSLVWFAASLSGGPATASAGGVGAAGSTGGFTALTDSGKPLPDSLVTQLRSQAVSAQMGTDGKQTLNMAVNGDIRSYNPKVIKVKQGVPLHINLGVEGADPG